MDNYEEKVSHLYQLYQLAIEDGILSNIEWAYIETVAKRLEVKLEDISKFEFKKKKLVLPDSEFKIIPLFYRLLLLMGIDSKIEKSEEQFCLTLGIRMGLHPQAVEETIGLIKDDGPMLDPNTVTDIFNKYAN